MAAAPARRLANVNDGARENAADDEEDKRTAGETVRIDRVATGGAGVARRDNGQVVFVAGALPDETVRIKIVESKKRFARARTLEVVDAGPARRSVACEHARSGACGGCDWMHVHPEAQRRFKAEIVADQLRRLGRLENPEVDHANEHGGPRTTVRCVVTEGKAGYRAPRSHRTFAATSCSAAHPLVEELIVDGRFGSAEQVTLRASVATGQRVAVIDGGELSDVSVPDDVVVVSAETAGDAAIEEVVGGHRFRVSAGSFFQASPQGAAVLAATVADHVNHVGVGVDGSGGSGRAVDLYGGVGLLGALAVPDRLSELVEWNAAAVADAGHNLRDLAVSIQRSKVENWQPAQSFELALADPARRGLGPDGVAAVGRSGARQLVVVNCDPAAAGRDAALLTEQGWRHVRTTVVDLFPDTSNIEAVSSYLLSS